MSKPARGLAIYGGAFNPPHRTHRRICEEALRQLPVDQLLLMPSGDHPHKRGDALEKAHHRLAMCRLAFDNIDGLVIDDREIQRSGPAYTVTTLEELRREHPDRELWFVIGADNAPLLPTWRSHHRILELARIATFPRVGFALDRSRLEGLDLTSEERSKLLASSIAMEPDAVSATDLRERIARGERSIAELDPNVESYIREHKLYGA
jgi:nicotinate-nucleotide adenylyltransferase